MNNNGTSQRMNWNQAVDDLIDLRGACDALNDGDEWWKAPEKQAQRLGFISNEARHEAFSTCRAIYGGTLPDVFMSVPETGLNHLLARLRSPEHLAERKLHWEEKLTAGSSGLAEINALLERMLDTMGNIRAQMTEHQVKQLENGPSTHRTDG